MSTARLGSMLRQLLRRVPPIAPGAVTDADLLERFTRQRDEAAFELLLWRHGPMVLSLCERLLPQEQDAEDAFQATFLVLVRKARSVSKRDSLASWLHKVAYRIACRARPRAPVLSNHADVVADAPASDDQGEVIWRDLRSMLDQELARLPESYRRPVVLCYLEGKTNEEAAQLLGWPKGTVATRLARARDRLRRAMQRRGWAVSSVALASVLTEKALAGAPSAELVRMTLRSALAYASGQVAAGVLPAKAIALTEGVLRIMWYGKLKMAACVLAAVVLAGTGIGFAVHQAWAGAADDNPARAEPQRPNPPQVGQAGQKADIDRLRREIGTLRTELEEARKEIKDLRDAIRLNAPPEKGPLYRGKPVSFWLEQAQDGDPAYRKDAVTALHMMLVRSKKIIPDVLPTLLAAIKDTDTAVRGNASSALSSVGPQVIPQLLEMLDQEISPGIRGEVMVAFGGMRAEAKQAVPAMIATTKHQDAFVRHCAIRSLGNIGADAKAVVPALIEALKGKDKDAQTYAIGALGGIGPEAKAAIPALMEIFRERLDDIVKRMETEGFGRAGGKGGRPISINSSESPDRIIRALLSIDPTIRDVLPRDLLEFQGLNSWHEVYQALSEKYGPNKKEK